MSDRTRGRVLIINIFSFTPSEQAEHTRPGSLADCNNLCKVFRELRFDIVDNPERQRHWTADVSRLID